MDLRWLMMVVMICSRMPYAKGVEEVDSTTDNAKLRRTPRPLIFLLPRKSSSEKRPLAAHQ